MVDIVQTLIPASNPAFPGDYTLMSTAEADNEQDLAGLNNTYTLVCYAGEIEDLCSWDGWTTGINNTVLIEPAAGEEHGGVIGAGFRIWHTQGASGIGTVNANLSYMVVRGITAEARGTPAFGDAAALGSGGNGNAGSFLEDCIGLIELEGRGINVGSTAAVTATNCLLVGEGATDSRAARYLGDGSGAIFKNCTFVNFEFGLAGDAVNTVVDNCAVLLSGTPGTNPCFTNTSGGSNNASSDATAPGAAPQVNIVITDGVDFVAPSLGDYRPAPSPGKLDGTGADLSADFTTDIAGDTRTVPWTIGAYIVAGAPPVGTQNMRIKVGGVWVDATPSIKVGAAWVPVDAYIKEGGVWVAVHEQ